MDESDYHGRDEYPDYDYYYSWDYAADSGCKHQWSWYLGFHVEKFWYCEKCGEKDTERSPPSM